MSRAPRRLQWSAPAPPSSTHPVRDTILVYGGLAAFLVVVSWATGGAVGKAVLVAAFFFVVAVSWSLYRRRVKSRAPGRREDE
jgi:Flp pilus assembly protein TadB